RDQGGTRSATATVPRQAPPASGSGPAVTTPVHPAATADQAGTSAGTPGSTRRPVHPWPAASAARGRPQWRTAAPGAVRFVAAQAPGGHATVDRAAARAGLIPLVVRWSL